MRRSVIAVSRAQATVYLVALLGWTVSFAIIFMAPTFGGPFQAFAEAVLPPAMFIFFSAIFAVAVIRVQRGKVAAERDGTLTPIMTEFIVMALGARLPIAVTSFSGRASV